MRQIARFHLSGGRSRENSPPRGLSCDEQGIFLADKLALTRRTVDAQGRVSYAPRHFSEINFLLSQAYGFEIDISDRAELLCLATEAMTKRDCTRGKLAAVHLKLPDLPSQAAVVRLQKAVEALDSFGSDCTCARFRRRKPAVQRRDVSDEPRIPAGSPGGGQWTTDESADDRTITRPRSGLLRPIQAVPVPLPGTVPLPLTPQLLPPIPLTPTIPYPQELFPTNPYPERAECREEWEFAERECRKLQARRKLVRPDGNWPGGFGISLGKCIKGMVSEECGGNPTDDDDQRRVRA